MKWTSLESNVPREYLRDARSPHQLMSRGQAIPPKNKNVLRWGIIGCARIAELAVAPGIFQSPNGVVHAVASRSLEKARDFGSRFGAEIAYGSYDELLKDPNVEAVYIPLPNTLHKEWTVRAAESGKHVMCEKPLASNASEAQEMVDACRRNNVLLMEAFQFRLHPQIQAVRRLLEEGRMGKVIAVTTTHCSDPPAEGNIRVNNELGGGPLADKGCYCVSFARLFMGDEPSRVFARGDFDRDGMDWRVTADMEFSGGRMAWMDTSHKLAKGSYRQVSQIYTEKGRILIPMPFAQRATLARGQIVDTTFTVSSDEVFQEREEVVTVKGVNQWHLEAEYFADRVLRGEPISYPMENGLAQTKV